jgi:hypothetical protein
MLSFEVKNQPQKTSPDELEIYCDAEGLASLLAQLRMMADDRTDHVHLMAESWGGSGLDDRPHGSDNGSIKHVKILMVGNGKAD